jgi:hypothetical protein
VAWNNSENPAFINLMTYWPLGSYVIAHDEVPTRISSNHLGRVANWGFDCDENGPSIKELFKALLDNKVFESMEPEEKLSFPKGPTKPSDRCYHYLDSLLKHVIVMIGTALHKPRSGLPLDAKCWCI